MTKSRLGRTDVSVKGRRFHRHLLAFTLVELLVVISIIALLLSILMPSLQTARKQARRVVCKSNLHQIGVVEHLYAADYQAWIWRTTPLIQENLPNTASTIRVAVYAMRKNLLENIVRSYANDDKLWVCPGYELYAKRHKIEVWDPDNSNLLFYEKDESDDYWPAYYRIGYVLTVGLGNVTACEPRQVKDSAIKPTRDRGDKILAVDMSLRWRNSWDSDPWVAHEGRNGRPEGCNRVHVDGSVSWNRPMNMALDQRLEHVVDLNGRRSQGKYDQWPSYGMDFFW